MKLLRIADLFCGAGGTTDGAVEAAEGLGYSVALTAVNHWDVAIETHKLNHPGARHFCTGVDDINPRTLFGPGELGLLWASPECTHHSQARGGKPINEQSRATAHCVTRWAEAVMPPVILVENVPEFTTWGPLDAKGQPLQKRKGEMFHAWVNMLRATGYRVDWRVLCAADYGDPTTRSRLFIQAVRGRRRICWPEPTHTEFPEVADLFGRHRQPWVPAREIIDWSIEGKSIYERDKPLCENTMARIMAGLKMIGLTRINDGGAGEAFIIGTDHTGRGVSQIRPASSPLSTVVSKAKHILVEPFIVQLRGTRESQIAGSAHSVEDPLGTVTAGGGHYGLVSPFIVQNSHGGDSRRVHAVDVPLPTVTGSREFYFCEPGLIPQHSCGLFRPVSQPAPTVACAGAIALLEPVLIEYYGTGGAASVNRPLGTVTTKPRFGLLRPRVIHDGKTYELDLRYRMLQPHELAGAQGFKTGYQFAGTQTEKVKQIGNAVPRRLARAIVRAVLSQQGGNAHE